MKKIYLIIAIAFMSINCFAQKTIKIIDADVEEITVGDKVFSYKKTAYITVKGTMCHQDSIENRISFKIGCYTFKRPRNPIGRDGSYKVQRSGSIRYESNAYDYDESSAILDYVNHNKEVLENQFGFVILNSEVSEYYNFGVPCSVNGNKGIVVIYVSYPDWEEANQIRHDEFFEKVTQEILKNREEKNKRLQTLQN